MNLRFAWIALCACLSASTVFLTAMATTADNPLLAPLAKGPAKDMAEAHYQLARCTAFYMNMSNLVGTRDQWLAERLDAKGKLTLKLAQLSGKDLGRTSSDVDQTVVEIVDLYKKLWEQNYYAKAEILEEISKSDYAQCNYMIEKPKEYTRAL